MKHIFVADDDPAIVDSLSVLLEDEGYAVIPLQLGTALPQITAAQPDLVLLDIWLSGQDGREICQALKAQPETSQIPIIIISAHKDTAAIAATSGADGFLVKPFNIEDVLQQVAELTQSDES